MRFQSLRRTPTTRDLRIDSIRGLACLLLVSFHVIGSDSNSGIKVDDESSFRIYTSIFEYIRMPLFSFLSGIVYAWNPVNSPTGLHRFMKGKSRRLLIPLVIFIAAIGILQSVIPGTNSRVDTNPLFWYLEPLSPYWFLAATFWIFLLVSLVDAFGLRKHPIFLILLIPIAATLDVWLAAIEADFDLLGIRSASFLLPFFLSGVLVVRIRLNDRPKYIRTIAVFGGFGSLILVTWMSFMNHDDMIKKHTPLAIVLSILACMAISLAMPRFRSLATIGAFSSGIYLLHPFASAGTRVILSNFGVNSLILLFFASLIVGIIGSILTVIVLRRWKIGSVILGEKWRVKKTEAIP